MLFLIPNNILSMSLYFLLDLKLYKHWINCLFALLPLHTMHHFEQGTSSPHDHPPSPTTHFFLKNFLHSSAISKHICANICVQCIDLQNIPKVKVCQILLISQNIELQTRHRFEVHYIDQRSAHKLYIDL